MREVFVYMLSYYKELFAYIQKLVHDKEYAKDITQETYMRTIEANSNSTIDNKRAFLYRVAKNIIIDQARKSKKNSFIDFEEEKHISKDEQAEELTIKLNENQVLLEEIKKLPQKRRQVFVLHIIEGYSRKEISQLLNITIGAVEKHISRASLQIKESLEKNKDVIGE